MGQAGLALNVLSCPFYGGTPTSGSWLNAAETFFSAMTRRRLRRGTCRSLVDLQAPIKCYLADHNANPQTFLPDRNTGKHRHQAGLAECVSALAHTRHGRP